MVPNSWSVSSVFLATENKREDQNRVCELYGDNLIKKTKKYFTHWISKYRRSAFPTR
jgi:hypothetical protein